MSIRIVIFDDGRLKGAGEPGFVAHVFTPKANMLAFFEERLEESFSQCPGCEGWFACRDCAGHDSHGL